MFKTNVNIPWSWLQTKGCDGPVTTKDSSSFFVMALGHVCKMALIEDCG
jgi:hypothetical protein